ncbi:TetR/AcrR family transcriptional regulator [Haliea sp. E17]|uniref:TetR/AcrR family transcriptional regulator n=1 Tax=Haliea sp. E17 TaxID=3401576 RepID=UPI003AAE780F
MTSTRRMGSVDSEMGESMLNAAEEILKDEGYAALTSRRVAEYSGVKQRLVYYYFRTMEDLQVETFKRLSIRELARLRDALASERPLHEVWDICVNSSDARLISEFMALANRNEGVRGEVITFIEESRKIQVSALRKAMVKNGSLDQGLPPDVIAFIGTSLALALNRESSIGVSKGHPAVKKTIKEFFESLEV